MPTPPSQHGIRFGVTTPPRRLPSHTALDAEKRVAARAAFASAATLALPLIGGAATRSYSPTVCPEAATPEITPVRTSATAVTIIARISIGRLICFQELQGVLYIEVPNCRWLLRSAARAGGDLGRLGDRSE